MSKDKLKPKGSGGTSLTNIAHMLKEQPLQTIIEEEETLRRTEEKTNVQEIKESSRKISNVVLNTKFAEILEDIENREYVCTGVIYIDEEIKEVLSLLKSKGKIKTSSLVSYILEIFLEQNKDDINAIIKSSNRFL
jgi:galactitol-specific phosphotransferase system IIB component